MNTPDATKAALNSEYIFMSTGDLKVKHAAILWSNFAGQPTAYNAAGGKRTFILVLTPEVGRDLQERGWNIKFREPDEKHDEALVFTEIVVNLDSAYPPTIYICSEFRGKKTKREATEDDVNKLDSRKFSDISVMIHPYEHGRPNPSGATVKGYLRDMYVVLANDDEFEDDYSEYEVPEEEFVPFN